MLHHVSLMVLKIHILLPYIIEQIFTSRISVPHCVSRVGYIIVRFYLSVYQNTGSHLHQSLYLHLMTFARKISFLPFVTGDRSPLSDSLYYFWYNCTVCGFSWPEVHYLLQCKPLIRAHVSNICLNKV